MLLIRLHHIAPLLNATSLFTDIADDNVTVKLTPGSFSMIAPHRSSRFVAVLKLPRQFFTSFSDDLNHTSKVSLHAFHTALLDASTSSSIAIHLLDSMNRLALRFENDSSNDEPEKSHELDLSPPGEDGEQLGIIDYGRFFGIDYQEFNRIIAEFSIYEDDILLVTSIDSRVIFSTPTMSITLHNEKAQCVILGHRQNEMTQFLFTIQPMTFFLGLTNQAQKIWFFRTIDSRGVIRVPFDTHSYMVYFNSLI